MLLPRSKWASVNKAPKKAKKANKSAKWAKNTKDLTEQKKKNKAPSMDTEDHHIRGKRIRDVGQPTPKGYMRKKGGRYFLKISNMRPITSMTTQAQRNLYWSNWDKFMGPKMDAGWLRSIGEQGMYNGETSEANFRKTSAARKLIDADGGTYAPNYDMHAGAKKQAKSRWIMAIGQDGRNR